MPSRARRGIGRPDVRAARGPGPDDHPRPGELQGPRVRGPRGDPEAPRHPPRDGDGPELPHGAEQADPSRAPREAPDRGPREADRRGPEVDLLRAHGEGPEDPPPGAGDDRPLPLPLRADGGDRRVRAPRGALALPRGPGDHRHRLVAGRDPDPAPPRPPPPPRRPPG